MPFSWTYHTSSELQTSLHQMILLQLTLFERPNRGPYAHHWQLQNCKHNRSCNGRDETPCELKSKAESHDSPLPVKPRNSNSEVLIFARVQVYLTKRLKREENRHHRDFALHSHVPSSLPSFSPTPL